MARSSSRSLPKLGAGDQIGHTVELVPRGPDGVVMRECCLIYQHAAEVHPGFEVCGVVFDLERGLRRHPAWMPALLVMLNVPWMSQS